MAKPQHLLRKASLAALVAWSTVPAIAAPGLIARDSNGVLLGTLVSTDSRGWSTVLTAHGYLVPITPEGEIGDQDGYGSGYFVNPDCSGQVYAMDPPIAPVVYRNGGNATGVSRIDRDAPALTLQVGDVYYGFVTNGGDGSPPTCTGRKVTFRAVQMLPIHPNDQERTGIGNGPFKMPIRVSLTGVFSSGFETA